MAYKSLFTPISQEDLNSFNCDHDITINEDVAPQAVTQMPQQTMPAQTVAPIQQPMPQTQIQPGSMPPAPQQAQQAPGQQAPAQQQATINPQEIAKLGKDISSKCPAAAQNPELMSIWKILQSQPTVANLMTYMSAFSKFASQQGVQQTSPAQAQAGTQQAQGQQTQAPAGTQPQAAPQIQAINNSLAPKSKWTLIKEKVRYNKALREAEEAKKTEIDKQEDIKPEKQQEKKEEASAKPSAKTDDFNDDKNVDYSAEYSEAVTGKKGETTVENKDKVMYDSIFGSKEDPFADSKEVDYHSAYEETGDGPTERDQNTTLTKPEPFKPENPKLTTLSDATAVSKTVFTIDDKGNVADTGASSDTKAKTQDDGSEDDDVFEGFTTKIPSFINEGFISDDLKRTIVKQFMNLYGEDFSIEDFSDWLKDEYPSVAGDPGAFDEVSKAVQDGTVSEDDEFDREPEGEDDDFKTDEDYTEKAQEYIDDTDLDEYDEDDAIAWCEDNYPEIASDDSELDNFLDAVCDMFVEDNISESFNDEFYADEKELNS